MARVDQRSARLGDVTRAQLVDAAARLFAEHGVDAVSVRAVNRAAGHAPAAVHYHFGSKDELLKAVLERQIDIVAHRTAALETQLQRSTRRVRAEDLVRVMTTPYLELLHEDPERTGDWLAVVAQLRLSRRDHVVALFEPVTAVLATATARCFPHRSAEEIQRALVIANGALLGALVRALNGDERLDLGALLDFAEGGFEAVFTPTRLRPVGDGGSR